VTEKPRGENGKLSKRLLAAFLVTLFIVSAFATVAEVQGHFTLGDQTLSGAVNNGTPFYPSHDTSLTNHILGSLAYVTPGLGYVPPAEQMLNYYSPDSAIITDTTGGLTFYINVTDLVDYLTIWNITEEVSYKLVIAIPPEFTPVANWTAGETTGVSTSITNDYACIATGQFASDHDVAPGWWYIMVTAETVPDHADQGFLYPPNMDPYLDRQARTGDFAGCYSVSTGNLKAPSCAGKYFFKIFVDQDGTYVESVPSENYPVLLVKGELDPGYIEGRVLYCGSYYYGYFYGSPITKAGRVIAEGTALDPVTNAPLDRKVCAVGYFNATANGHYEIEGLAPGVYTLTAEAAGFPPATLATQITVKRGQSLHGIDIYVCPGAKIQLKVNSKCPTGAVPWPENYAINWTAWEDGIHTASVVFPIASPTWELLDETGKSVIPHFAADAWIITIDDVSFTMYIGDPTSYEGTETYWDGHVPQFWADWISGLAAGAYYPKVNVFGYVQLTDYPVVVPASEYTGWIYREMDLFKGGTVTATVHFHNQEMPSAEAGPVEASTLLIEARDAENNLWAWNETDVAVGQKNVQIRVIGDSSVPYGMIAGTYTFKVYYIGYVQQEFPQQTIQLCTSNAFSFHLVKGGNVTVTVYSRDWENPAQPLMWLWPDAHLRVYFYDSKGGLIGHADGYQAASTDKVTFAYWGDAVSDHTGYLGFGTDVYSIKAYTVGYVQKVVPEVWVQKATSTGDIPLYLYAGARIMCTVNFKTEQLFCPLSDSAWSYYFRINVYDSEGKLAAANITSVPQATVSQPGGVQTWVFDVVGFGGATTPNYIGLYPANWPAADTYQGSWIPEDRFGYWEPSSLPPSPHLDTGIPGDQTYTVQLIDETNGYIQTATVAATVSWMGTAMLFFDMHKQASISGTLYERNYMGDFRLAAWYTVDVTGSAGAKATSHSADGDWSVSVPADTYTVKVSLMVPDESKAVVGQDRTVVVTWGADSSGQNFYLEEGGVPIPEFPAAGVLMLISALAASLYLLRWRKQAILPVP
jgi:hypothetical protein